MSATALALRPMEWGPLQDIDDVAPLGPTDGACLRELHAVLKRHGMEARFGVTLLHKHFPLAPDEVLLEHTDPVNRRLVLQPAKADSPEVARSMQTSWMLTEDQGAVTNTACYRRCVRNIHGNHETGEHYWA